MIRWTGDHETPGAPSKTSSRSARAGTTFADLNAGEAIFLDANPFVHHFVSFRQLSAVCSQLLQRWKNQEALPWMFTHVLTEMAHGIRTIEAIGAVQWPMSGIVRRLRKHPARVQQLAGFQQAVDPVLQSRIQVLTIPVPLIAEGRTEPADRTAQQLCLESSNKSRL